MSLVPLTLDPAGSQAAPVATLSWVLFAGGTVIFVVVMGFVAVALFGPARWKQALGRERTILWGGLAFPIVLLSVLLVWGLGLTASLGKAGAADPLEIRVVGERWWWRVDYPSFTTANEIVVPVGRPVTLELISNNVIHSFWVPRLAGKRDMIPGKVNRLTIVADRPGDYFGICAEYCGSAHALMQFRLIALEPPAYARWEAAQARPALSPRAAIAQRGEALFQTLGCGGCHRVAGTRAQGLRGPDLTHLASRRTIAAGIMPNNARTLAAFTADPQAHKPNVLMPGFGGLSAPELLALAAYMDGLE